MMKEHQGQDVHHKLTYEEYSRDIASWWHREASRPLIKIKKLSWRHQSSSASKQWIEIIIKNISTHFCHKSMEKSSRRHQSSSATKQERKRHQEGTKAVLPKSNKEKSSSRRHQSSSAPKQQEGTKAILPQSKRENVIKKAPKQFCLKAIKRNHQEGTKAVLPQTNKEKSSSRSHKSISTKKQYRYIVI